MGMLKQAFNSMARLHSREATLKRLGTPTISTPIRITPSNYSRFLAGPSSTVVQGREWIVTLDSLLGYQVQKFSFETVPTSGSFVLSNAVGDSDAINFDASAADVETAVHFIPGYENVTVTGNIADGFKIAFVGVGDPLLLNITLNLLVGEGQITNAFIAEYVKWVPVLKRGDKIYDPLLGHMAIISIVEIPDLGGDIMGYRVDCE